MTPQENLDIVLRVCRNRNLSTYSTECVVLAAFAESDFDNEAVSKNPVNASGFYSEGLFQQTLPWWTNDHFDPYASTNAFIDNLRETGDRVVDCYNVQHWLAPSPQQDMKGFLESKETINYTRRVDEAIRIVRTGKLKNA